MCTELGIKGPDVAWPVFVISLFAGLTMVTNVPFYSFKDIGMKRSVPFAVIVLVALVVFTALVFVLDIAFGDFFKNLFDTGSTATTSGLGALGVGLF
jgi:CDP-diacylglycerol--serine O-phosphatidyltransferase